MTPEALLSGRTTPLRLVIFDCDGVIVDSEGIASRVTAGMITDLGWKLEPHEAQAQFVGMTLADMLPLIEAKTGRPVPSSWLAEMRATFLEAMRNQVEAIPGGVEALHGVTALGLPWRIASNSSHEEMRLKFARIGITEHVAGRVHSHRDVARGKPHPDVFLAAATAEGVHPSECIVIEDSTTGARAAAAAAMDCLGYAPHSDGAALRSVGAVPFRSMYELPALLSLAPRTSPP